MDPAQAPAGTPDTPTPGAPEEGHAQQPTPEVNWQERYENLQSAYNRRDQELAEARQYQEVVNNLTNPETAPDVLRALGYEVPQAEQTPHNEFVDPIEQRFAQIEQTNQELLGYLRTQQEQTAQQQQEQALANQFGMGVHQLEQQIGRELNETEMDFVHSYAYLHPEQSGAPDVTGAWERLSAAYEAQQEQWLRSKQTGGAPGTGQSASKEYDLSTPAGRREAAEARLAALDDGVALT